jgi:TonB family protein
MQTTAVLADRQGRVIDARFSLLRWLGGSEEGSVYLTEFEGTRATIKLVPAASAGAEARLAGWTAAANLSHPHLTRVFHAGRAVLDADEVIYCVSEHADEVLSEILPTRPLSPDETRQMLGPVLDALAYLHGQGFAHGRLKPSNILVVADNLKLSADFSPVAPGKAATISLDLKPYDAPELGRSALAPAADTWSLGMTVVAALTQHTPPWDRESGFEPVVRPALPAPFEAIVRDCLRLDPASRITLPEITARLEGDSASQAATAAPHADFDPDFNPAQAHSSRWASVWIAAAVFLGIAVTALVLQHSRQSAPSDAAAEPAPAAEQQPAASSSAPVEAVPSAAAQKPSAAAPAHPVQAAAPGPVGESEPPAYPSTVRGDAGNGNSGNGAIVKRVLPDVLPEARASIRGKVLIAVRVQVDASGAVTDAVSESPGASHYFNRIAVQAAQAWQFAPAPASAPATWVLHFQFRQDGTAVTADRQAP